jgi:DNA-directed RNA polymerase subunit RPC12/RpoP
MYRLIPVLKIPFMIGYACSYLCRYCRYEEVFRQGPGYTVKPQSFQEYMSGNSRLFHYKIHDKIVALAKVYPDLLIGASFQVYKCPHCKILHNKVQVNIYADDKLLHVNLFKCSRCRRRLRLTNINRLKTAVCPGCLKSTFQRQKPLDVLW